MESRKKSILIALSLKRYNKNREYVQWKADLCNKVTGKKCKVIERNSKYTFNYSYKYFRILKGWNKNLFKYLDELGLAIWYMDDGSLYVRKDESAFNCELATFIPKEDAEDLINMFQEKWNIKFNLHHVGENQYNLRTCSHEGAKFIELIRPFVPDCMSYKLKIPERFIHERVAV